MENNRSNLQEYLNSLFDELGSPGEWSQEDAHQFYVRFFSTKLLGSRLILEITDIKEYQNFNLFIAVVLNPDTFMPFILPFNRNKWTLAFTISKNGPKYKKGDILTAIAEELKINELPNENRRLDILSINVSSIKYSDLETVLSINFGEIITKKIIEQFGSLGRIASLIISQIESGIDDSILRLGAELNKRNNELQAKFKEQEIELQEEYKRKLEHLNKELSKIDRKEKKIEGMKKLIKDEEVSLDNKSKEIQKQKEVLDKKFKQLEEYKEKIEYQFKKFRLLHPLLGNNDTEPSNDKTIKWSDQEDIIATIQGALHEQCNLQYERDTIECFVGALKTNQLIILHGPSGTGKSSLVRNFSKIIKGAKTYTIRVQSSWTDKQDILGFFNPIDYQYVSTEFLDALVEAKQNPKSLYLICLDEMNLSHVEYYFAEFLSAREEKVPKITLYSKRFQQLAQEIINPYIITDENGLMFLDETKCEQVHNDSERLRLQNCFDLCYRYPAEFEIPSNVRFIGTMNMDDTVKGLSPKVIDRSFIIELRHPENEEALKEELEKIKVSDLLSVDLEVDFAITDMDNDCRQKIKEINHLLAKLGARLNHRALDQIGYYGSAVNSELKFDQIVRGKILPRIQVLRNDETEKTLKQLKDRLDISPLTKKKIDEMLSQGRTITYWR